jgi:hypothetical protein
MKTKNTYFILAVVLLVLLACQSVSPATPTAVPTATSLPPTNTSVPTNTALPTETPKPTNTPLPAGVIFRDDFSGELQSGWEWQNENPDKWTLTDDGWLQIIGEHDSLLGENNQNNLLWYTLPAGDFIITAHLKTKPFENFHQATIYIYEDPENYVAINRGYCDVCSTGGGGFYMEYKISGQWGSYTATTKTEDVYLKLESANNTISGYYATEPDNWVRLGRFGNYFQFKKVGIGVTNVRASNDVVGLFDYFEITQP